MGRNEALRKVPEDMHVVVARLNKEAGVTYAQIAVGFDVSVSLISKIARGERALKRPDGRWVTGKPRQEDAA